MYKNKTKRSLFLFISFVFLLISGVGMWIRRDNMQICANAQAWSAGKAECVMELQSRRILYASNADTRLPMASTTKILTAITVLENAPSLNEELIIPESATGIEGSSVYLKSGDKYTVEDLLYGLMLRSGNDCATALALRFGGSIGGFSAKMNKVAQASGAVESNFENPHGLPCADHYTTARDLSLITCYAMQNPTFEKIVSSKFYAPRSWQNKNKLLRLYDGAIGVKTGYTKEAGRCLVSCAKRENMTLVCTLLNCPTTYERTMVLFDDAFSAYKNVLLVEKDAVFEVESGNKKVKGTTGKDFYYPLLDEEKELVEIKTNVFSIDKSEKIIGQLEIYLAKRLLFSANLYKL